jgi:TRAP-type C4-dicarboxylate transport system substrate-binding protein
MKIHNRQSHSSSRNEGRSCHPCMAWSLLFILLLAITAIPGAAHAKGATYLFKIASLAPEGSIWAKRFNEFADEVRAKSNGDIEFRVYPGGVMGDDQAMYRKMRIGQLQGGGFTMTGISDIVPDFRVMGIPFLFNSYDEVDYVSKGLRQPWEKDFAAKGMQMLALTEVGFIYTMSVSPITTVAQLKQSKCWAPEGDPISATFLENLGVTPVQLSIPDVLTSLQTGLINTTFNSFYGSIVLQWFTQAKYITDIPFAYAYGVLIIDKKAFDRLPPAYAAMMKDAAVRKFSALVQDTRKSNADSLTVLEQNGIRLVKPTPATLEELDRTRDKTVSELVGTAFSKQIYATLNALLDEYRKTGEGKEEKGSGTEDKKQ